MRFPIRSFATLVMMVGVATCSDTPIAAVKTGSSPSARFGIGQIALSPVFSKSAQYAAAHLADFPSVRFDSVRVVIRGIPDTTQIIKDTTVFFDVNSTDLALELNVPVQNDGQKFQAGMDYRGPSGVVFHGVQTVQSHRPDQPAPAQQPILINYVGTGANVKTITVVPRTLSLVGSQATSLAVTAVDSNNNAISVPLAFTSSNPSIATVSNVGFVQGQNRRGSATITVRTPSGISDVATASVSLQPSAIGVAAGNGQTGRVGTTLANPAVVFVSASDGIGVPGVSVIFSAPIGGSVSSTTATTDASGRASTTMKLGNVAGPQGFTATAAGVSTAINVTATPGDPSALKILSGNNQADSVRAALAPLSVRVADSFDNPISGVAVSWTKSGGGSLGSASTTTNSDGIATNSYTLGTALGTETVTATAGSASAAFTFTVNGGRPASIVAVSGGGQTALISQALTNPLVVKVADAAGNPVRDAAITWTALNATITSTTASDANGQASANVTLGTAAGPATVNAAIAGGTSVSFAATAQAGTPATILFIAQPASVAATQTLAPVRVSLRDAGNNAADGTVTIVLANSTNGAVLGGTRTQNTSNGVATFSNLTVDRLGTGYALRASVNGLSATSNLFNVTAGAAASLTIVAGNGASARVNTAVTTAPSVKLVDGANNPIVGASVTFAPGAGSGSVAPVGGVVTTDALGIATLTSWTLGPVAGSQTLTASATGLQPVTFTATATAGSATRIKLVPSSPTSISVVAGQAPSLPQVRAEDANGNPIAGVTIKAVVDSGTTNVGIVGTDNFVTNASGLASLTAPAATIVGTYRLTATSAGIADTLRITATVTAGPAYRVAFKDRSSLQTSVTSGVALAPQPTIWVLDQYGNPVPASGVSVTLTTAPSSGLSAPLSLEPSGSGAFSGVSLSGSGSMRLVVTASSTALAADSSNPIAVSAPSGGGSTATQIERYGASSFSGVVGSSLNTRPAVLVKNGLGNPVAGTSIVFTLASDTLTIDGTRRADTVTTNSSGIAAMSVWKLPRTVGTYSVAARPATGSLTGSPVTFTASATAGDLNSLTFVTNHGVPASFENNSSFSNGPQLLATDIYGNPIAGVMVDVTIDSVLNVPTSLRRPGPAANLGMFPTLPTMSVSYATTNANGIADFGGVKFRGQVQRFRLIFIARGTTVMVASSTALRHGAMNKAICTASLPGRVGLGHRLSNSPKLKLVDIDENIVDNMPVTLTAQGTLSSNNGTSDSNGEVTVSTWTVRGSAGDDSLKVNGIGGGCKVVAAAVHHIKLSLTALGTKKNGDLIPSIDATVVDVDDNAIEDETFTVDVLGRSTQGKPIFISKSKSSNGRGKSTFDDLTIDAQAQDNATLDFSLSGATGITGQITLSVIDGDPSDLDAGGALSVHGVPGTLIVGTFSVQVKDHGKRNNLNSATNTVAWNLGAGCAYVSFPDATTTQAVNGIAVSPMIAIGLNFASTPAAGCVVTASAPNLSTVTFTITP